MNKARRRIGQVKRSLLGVIRNRFEKFPIISSEIRFEVVGQTLGGQSIKSYRIGDGNKSILFVSGIHGNEVGTVKLACRLTNYFYKNSKKFDKFSIFIIPCLNIDGLNLARNNPDYIHSGKIGRFNANNVDLNRNFDVKSFCKNSIWSHGENYSTKTEVFCGENGNSESETISLTQFILNNKIEVVVAFHNAGSDVMGNSNDLSQRLARIFAEKTGFNSISENEWKGLKQTGTAKEWCDENSVVYLEVEGSQRYGSDWKIQKPGILAILNELVE